MDSTIAVALIGAGSSIIVGGLTLMGVLVSNKKNSKSVESKITTNQAVFETKLDELTREVRQHNDFATKIPALEAYIQELQRDLRALAERVDRYHI